MASSRASRGECYSLTFSAHISSARHSEIIHKRGRVSSWGYLNTYAGAVQEKRNLPINFWNLHKLCEEHERQGVRRRNHVLAGHWNFIILLQFTCQDSSREATCKSFRMRSFITSTFLLQENRDLLRGFFPLHISNIANAFRNLKSPDPMPLLTCTSAAYQTCQQQHVSCHDVISGHCSTCFNKYHLAYEHPVKAWFEHIRCAARR